MVHVEESLQIFPGINEKEISKSLDKLKRASEK